MKLTLTTKLAAATGLTALVLGGLVPPVAQADPIAASGKSSYGQLVGVGSDTLQDVDNGLQRAIGRVSNNGLWKLASYDATGSNTFTPNATTDPIGRPNGSGDGLKALLVSIGQTATNTGTTFATSSTVTWASDGGINDVVGDIHYSRSSDGPTAVSSGNPGSVNYIPFAKDALTYATAATGKFPALILGTSGDTADGTTGEVEESLFAIFKCQATAIVTNKAGVPQKLVKRSVYTDTGAYNAATEDLIDIKPLLPQAASGTSKFWANYFYGTKTPTLTGALACVSRTIADQNASDAATDSDDVNDDVQEHSGASLVTAGSIVPFSIPKWIAMAKGLQGVLDVRSGAVLGTLNSVAPTSGSGQAMVINNTFLTNTTTDDLTRTIYHVVPNRLVTDESTLEYAMFNGEESLVCQNEATISSYGFGLLTGVNENSCGYVADSLRAASLSDITITTNTITKDDVAGEFDVVVAGFTNVGNENGAKVRLYATDTTDEENVIEFDAQYDGAIADGLTETSFSVPYAALPEGSWKVGLVVIPNNAGAETFVSAADLTTKSMASLEVTAVATKGKVNKAGKVRVTVSPATTGVVNVYKDSNMQLLGTGTITSGGTVTITLRKQKRKGNYALLVRFMGNATYASTDGGAIWKVK
jgi:hypothetical protein